MTDVIFEYVEKLLSLLMSLIMLISNLFSGVNSTAVTIDADNPGDTVPAVVNTLNVWNPYAFDENTQPDSENDVMSFVDYIELMTATGGSEENDPFVNPLDTSVLDDYDFSRIVSSCRGVLNLGAKPFLILGNVPLKLSENPVIGGFGYNVCPPKDYNEWYKFICAYLTALTDKFGVDEVRTWRFGVLTEYENEEWFSVDGDADKTYTAYCKLYDYTVKALTDTLGNNVYVGAHSMTVTEGLWDERDFIKHCASGINYATGKTGTRICYLTSSFYDNGIYEKTDGKRPAECIEFLRAAAEENGLNNLDYGFDEGRILSGKAGADDSALSLRSVGDSSQAAYDAKLYKEIIEAGASWFSSWGYTTGGAVNGFASVAYHQASLFAKTAGKNRLDVSVSAKIGKKTDKNAFAAKDSETGAIYISAYNYKFSKLHFMPCSMKITVNDSSLKGRTVEIRTYYINDDCNFFDEWQTDAAEYISAGTATSWSPDSFALDNDIVNSELREKYTSELREKYKELSVLTPVTQTVEVADTLTFTLDTDANTAAFVEIIPQ